MENQIEVQNLSFTYQTPEKEVEAIHNISFRVKEKNFCSILGPSGCGKSTLLSAMVGLLPVANGEIKINTKEKKPHKVGFMPQNSQLFEWYNIWDNITLGLKICHMYDAKHIEYVNNLLKKYGLYEYRNMRVHELSGGMQQRCSLIRTLAVDPEILLLDESFSALDYQTRIQVSEDIRNIIKEQGKTAILVTHDIPEAISLSDQIVVLSRKPADVVDILDLEDISAISPQDRRNDPRFQIIYNRIWKKLNASICKAGGDI